VRFLLLIIFCFSSLGELFSQNYAEHVQLVLNFAKFIDWTRFEFNNPNDPIVIGVYEGKEYTNTFDYMAKSQRVSGKELVVKHFVAGEDLTNCNILFLPHIKEMEITIFLKKLDDHQIVTIANNIDGFCRAGGIINLTLNDPDYQFQINYNKAVRDNIAISPQVLIKAKIINSE